MHSWTSFAKKKSGNGGGGENAEGWTRLDGGKEKQNQLTARVAQFKVKIYHQGSNEIVLLGITASISKAKRMEKWNHARKWGNQKI